MKARRAALESVYRRRYDGFLNAVATITGDYESARDSVQEGFARALAHIGSYRGDGALEAWVWQIVFRTALANVGRNHGETLDDLEIGIVHPERDEAVAAAIRTLSPRRRLIVFLRYFADLTYSDIALVCEISEGTVAATIAQAHEHLQRQMEQEVHDERPVTRAAH